MNFAPMEATPSDLLREFEDFAKTISTKSVSKEIAGRCSRYIAALLSDSSIPISPVLAILQGLRSGMVPPGAAAAWPSMDDCRKDAYLKWIGFLPGEKAAMHQIDLAFLLLDSDPKCSLNLLQTLTATKAVKERLAKTFLSGETGLASLTTCETLFPRVRKALYLLLQSCNSVPSRAKWQIVRLTLEYGVQRNMQSDLVYAPLLQIAFAELSLMETQHREEARKLLAQLDPSLQRQFFPCDSLTSGNVHTEEEITNVKQEQISPEVQASEPTPSGGSTSVPNKPVAAEPVSAASQSLERWIGTLLDQISVLENARTSIWNLERERDSLIDRLQTTTSYEESARKFSGENETLRFQLIQTEKARHSIAADCLVFEKLYEEVRTRYESVEADLRDTQAALSSERAEWQHRVQANANGLVEEFRNSLAGSLKQLLAGVPGPDSSVDSELGAVLLLRLHEVMDTLERKGLRIRRSEEAQS